MKKPTCQVWRLKGMLTGDTQSETQEQYISSFPFDLSVILRSTGNNILIWSHLCLTPRIISLNFRLYFAFTTSKHLFFTVLDYPSHLHSSEFGVWVSGFRFCVFHRTAVMASIPPPSMNAAFVQCCIVLFCCCVVASPHCRTAALRIAVAVLLHRCVAVVMLSRRRALGCCIAMSRPCSVAALLRHYIGIAVLLHRSDATSPWCRDVMRCTLYRRVMCPKVGFLLIRLL